MWPSSINYCSQLRHGRFSHSFVDLNYYSQRACLTSLILDGSFLALIQVRMYLIKNEYERSSSSLFINDLLGIGESKFATPETSGELDILSLNRHARTKY